MDTLSSILERFHIESSLMFHFRCTGDWGIDFSPAELPQKRFGVAFHHFGFGEGELLTETGVHHIDPGDLVLLPAGSPHSLATQPHAPCKSIYEILSERNLPFWAPGMALDQPLMFEIDEGLENDAQILSGVFNLLGPGATQMLNQLPAVVHIRAAQYSLNPQLKSMLEFVLCEARSPQPGYRVVASRLMDVLFIQILRAVSSSFPIEAGWLKGIADSKIGAVLSALHQAPHRKWSVEEMARVGGLSRTSFVTRFREIVGKTPMCYLTEWRMQLAATALEDPDRRICQIGEEVGYPVAKSFTRAFRQATGLSPLEYRRAVQRQNVA